MAGLKIYGQLESRAFRPLWMAEELGLDYEHIPTRFDDECKTPAFLAMNPNGKVPVMQDGDLTLYESMAITLYLGRKHGGALWPAALEGEGRLYQWTLWVMTEVEMNMLDGLLYTLGGGGHEKDQDKAKASFDGLTRQMAVLNAQLSTTQYLLGDDFTLADLNVAAVISWGMYANMDFANWPTIIEWAGQCLARPAAAKLISRL